MVKSTTSFRPPETTLLFPQMPAELVGEAPLRGVCWVELPVSESEVGTGSVGVTSCLICHIQSGFLEREVDTGAERRPRKGSL